MLSLFRSIFLVLFGMGMCVGTLASEIDVQQDFSSMSLQGENIGEIFVDDLFSDDLLPLEEIDLDNLRSFEDELEPIQISFKEKVEMIFLLFKSKTRGYRGGLLAHFEQHSNEYLIGSACIATMLIAALLKKYTSHLCATTNGQ